jgi:hypothetical protein
MGKPWAEAGHEVICVDLQHPKDGRYENGISFIHLDLSWDSEAWKLLAESLMGKEVFVIGFPPCTNLAASGSRHWQEKREADPEFQHKAAACAIKIADLARAISAPYMIENPVGVLARLWRKPDYTFAPCDFGGYLPPDDQHPLYPDIIPPRDAYEKKTCLWTGGGFVFPELRRVEPQYHLYRHADGRLLKVSGPVAKIGGDSLRTKNIRSATPRGFALAVYYANRRPV